MKPQRSLDLQTDEDLQGRVALAPSGKGKANR